MQPPKISWTLVFVEAVVRHLKSVAGMNGQAISLSRLDIVRAVAAEEVVAD